VWFALAGNLVSVGCGSDVDPVPADPTAIPAAEAEVASPPAYQRPGPSDAEIDVVRRSWEADPDNVEARRRLAIALYDAGQRDEAIEHFEVVVEQHATVGNLLNLGRAYTRVSRQPEAEAVYRRVLDASPNHPVALHSLGNLAMRRGEADVAAGYYREATEARPDFILAWFHLAEARKDSGQFSEAQEMFAHVLELQPRTPEDAGVHRDALYEIASLDITMGAHDRAAESLAELVAADPGHKKAHYAYGQVLMHLGRVEEAQQQFQLHMDILARQETSGTMAMDE
jgi:tetratricopeptide (TPR) repeat protein